MEQKIKMGISSCVLGEKVRYDGGHKLDHYLKDTLGQFVEWTPVCPEVECGLSVPREAMRLTGTPEAPRLVTRKTGIDYTDRMQQWPGGGWKSSKRTTCAASSLKAGRRVPACGGVKVYNTSAVPSTSAVGIFASAYMEHFPLMPVEDDGRLNDPDLRENFIESIFVFKRWKELVRGKGRIRDLVDFHSDHKLLILSHSPRHYSALGRLVANAKEYRPERLKSDYLKILMDGLKLLATVKKNTNVLQHMMGYFKKQLQPDEKKEMGEVIEKYHRGLVPLIVPIVFVRHYVRKYGEPYLKRQYFLNPHHVDLMLRNHV